MQWVVATAAVCWIGLFIQIQEVVGKCELTPYKPAKTVTQITTNLKYIVHYCEKKIAEVEIRKKALQKELTQIESLNAKSAQEKREKEKKMKNLNEVISKLDVEIRRLQQRITTTTAHRNQLTNRIVPAGRRIVAANNRVNQLTRSIRGKQAHIEALKRRIAKERAKRRCHFGRKRRSVERAPRVRRGWRVRRFVRKVVRETKRVVKQVVTLPKCVVDNIVSRLSRSKEKAEREKNRLNQQLLQAQREKVNVEGERRKLIAQKAADSRTLNTLNASLRSMNVKKSSNVNLKTTTNRNICFLSNRIAELAKLLQTTDKRLTFLRVAKTKLLSILTQLKTIHNEKLADLEETQAAGEDVNDILEDIKEINEAIKKSVATLIQITCGSSFTTPYPTGAASRLMRVAPGGNCGMKYPPRRISYPIIRRPRPISWRRRAPRLTARDIMARNRG